MKNKVVKKLMMIVMAATMLSGFSFATVYANADPPAEETTTEVVAETSSEATTEENTEDTGRVIAESDSSAFSTPGNAQLVDDKENDDTKQFLTIQTKKGNTFYMVIDRSSTSENVYMMSLVDENDLAEFLDFFIGSRILFIELVAREAEDFQALVLVFLIQFLKACKLRCESALACCIDDQNNLAFILRERNFLALHGGACKIINAHYVSSFILKHKKIYFSSK